MVDIKIHPHSEVFVRIETDRGILQEMADHFSFFVPGYKFTPKFKLGMWDGKIRLLNLGTSLIYKGLLHYIIDFAKRQSYSFACEPSLRLVNDFNSTDFEKFLSFIDCVYTPKDYQMNGFMTCVQNNRALILSPTGSGKSLMIYLLATFYPKRKLIIVPTINLVHQLAKDFLEYSSGNFDDVLKITGETEKGWQKKIDASVVISTWQSIAKMPKSFFQQFNVVIGDEAHLCTAKSLSGILEKLDNCKFRFGFTGTLDGAKANQLVLEGLFGKVTQLITTKELMDTNQLATLDIKIKILKYSDEHKKLMAKSKYKDEMNFIVGHEPRNHYIRDLAISCKGNTLVLFQYVERHGKILHDMIISATKKKRKVFFIFGGTAGAQREAVRGIVEQEKDAIIIASYGTYSTGINIKNLHNVIFASPSKGKIRNLQSIGRGLRISTEKNTCTLYDIADDLTHNSYINHTLGHLHIRVKIYIAEKFNYSIEKVILGGIDGI
jgi:superfamily II DNA or RNA helicase